MIVVNFLGGPSSGKSTTAAFVFAKLKLAGVNTELIAEYAKSIVYQKRYKLLENQLYITAKQHKFLADVRDYEKVPIVITDTALLLGKYYGRNLPYYKEYCKILDQLTSEFLNFNVFVYRNKEYNPSGRTQTEEEAKSIDKWILGNIAIDYSIIGDETGANQLVEEIKTRFVL